MTVRYNPPVQQPQTIRFYESTAYDLKDMVWGPFESGGNNYTIKFERLSKVCTPELLNVIKATASARLESLSASTVLGDIRAMSALAELVTKGRAPGAKLATITADDIREFALEYAGQKYLVVAKTFVLDMLAGEHLAHDEELEQVLESKVRHKDPYAPIKTLDPNQGPYLDSEIFAIDQGLQEAHRKGEKSDEDYLIAMTFRLYGQRPVSIAALKLGDIETPKLTGANKPGIRLPIRKKQHAQSDRGQLRPAPMFFVHVLEKHALKRKEEVSEIPWRERPLFTPKRAKSPNDTDLMGHYKSGDLGKRYINIMKDLNVRSPRTGKQIKINARRDRHTVGTLLGVWGCPRDSIGAWLAQDDPQSCEPYVEVATRHHQLMSSMLDGKFEHLAAGFFGKVIEAEEVDDFDLSAIIPDFNGDQELGGCASGGCGALKGLDAPFACFNNCHSFRLSKHAELTPLLEFLVGERQRLKPMGDTDRTREIDRYIAAIAGAKKALEELK